MRYWFPWKPFTPRVENKTMAVRVFGVGLGLFIVFFVWSIALISCLVFSRSKGPLAYAGFGCCLFALLLTLVLCFIPKSPELSLPQAENKIYDEYFIGRVSLFVLMGITAIVSIILVIVMHCMVPVYAKPLKLLKTQ